MAEAHLSIILHWHHPWVLHHDVWPHGEVTLYESMAQAYIPQLSMLERLLHDGYRHVLTISTSPVLLAQLRHPDVRIGFNHYLDERFYAIREARKVARFSGLAGNLLDFWEAFYTRIRTVWEAKGGDLIAWMRDLHDRDAFEWATTPLSHPFLPHLGWDAWIRWHLHIGLHLFEHITGRSPTGFWLPELAYRPEGVWQPPVTTPFCPGGYRPSLAPWLDEARIDWIVLDPISVASGAPTPKKAPVQGLSSRVRLDAVDDPDLRLASGKDAYYPYHLHGTRKTAFFIRDGFTARRVWSRFEGYPGDPVYLEFHKRTEESGLRLWAVTGVDVDLGQKRFYEPETARQRAAEHARDFVKRLITYVTSLSMPHPMVITAPFDGELFGHWWFEGPVWLDAVIRRIGEEGPVEAITPGWYLKAHPPRLAFAPHSGTWGEGGDDRTWVNGKTRWLWERVYQFEREILECELTAGLPPVDHRCILSEMAFLHASDWPFLITTGQAGAYATRRFKKHARMLRAFLDAWQQSSVPEPGLVQTCRVVDSLLIEGDPVERPIRYLSTWDRLRLGK